ncbi:MAG: DNA adenine methylase [Sulfuriferula sp.]|nr:DNA adenine methylase [Sulfuriferula sp.]
MKSIPHPIQYQGSKRMLASAILKYVPDNTARLVEPFSGSAAISIACAYRQKSSEYWINDANKPLAELLRLIVDSPLDTAAEYERIWNAQHDDANHFYQVRAEFNRSQSPYLFLYLLARCVKGAVRYNADGEFNQSPDKRRFGTQPKTMRNNMMNMSALLKGHAHFSSLDYRHVLTEVQSSDVVYMDPPYQGVCGERDSRYFSGITHGDFISTLDDLNAKGISYIVSYDGRRGDKAFGESLPKELALLHIELNAGRSSQSTLLGREEITYESLYISKALAKRCMYPTKCYREHTAQQLTLLQKVSRYA